MTLTQSLSHPLTHSLLVGSPTHDLRDVAPRGAVRDGLALGGLALGVAADAELAKDKTYFAHHELSDVPVAIGPLVSVKVVDGKVVYEPHKDINDEAYRVGGIPQIMLVDKKGTIRLIMVGYDDANEPKLAKMIEDLLKEK